MRRFLLVMLMLVSSFGQNWTSFANTLNVACSANDLIAALESANTTPGDDIINLQAGCTYILSTVNNSESGGNGLPVIASAATAGKLTINGNGAKIVRGVYICLWLPVITNSTSTSRLTINAKAAPVETSGAAIVFAGSGRWV